MLLGLAEVYTLLKCCVYVVIVTTLLATRAKMQSTSNLHVDPLSCY